MPQSERQVPHWIGVSDAGVISGATGVSGVGVVYETAGVCGAGVVYEIAGVCGAEVTFEVFGTEGEAAELPQPIRRGSRSRRRTKAR